ncbi:sigma-70 family RNA polymerase sigma factor [Lutispora saccharofermentans]|uniref:Sigma-70 family RNA polymerase sigma factor n=1 Tax=Lutispora saccharofermentans TaxID=3024236 RepID=A0ABT1NBA1_9FIRM|nr:sigma-70 family RNA polymerase sigma factor [Lutispora saccharofermentans]MCQ1528550.1 sigma-70 family RNA polymerase sigma factor [Lutispora saccharofermentans]
MDKAKILEEVSPLIISSINKYAKSKGEFEDLYQEGALAVLESLDKYEQSKGVNIFYYLKLQLKFFYLNYERYGKKTVSLDEPIGEGISLADTLTDESSDVEDIVFANYESQEAYKALQDLAREERYIIEQSIIYRRTLDDLAKELGMSRTTLFRRKSKILDKLSDRLYKE